MTIFLGCYTDEAHANGLKALELDADSGEVQGLKYEKDTGMFKTIATLKGLFRPVVLPEPEADELEDVACADGPEARR